MKKLIAKFLNISESSLYVWQRKTHVNLISFINKYLKPKDLDEFIHNGKVSKFEYFYTASAVELMSLYVFLEEISNDKKEDLAKFLLYFNGQNDTEVPVTKDTDYLDQINNSFSINKEALDQQKVHFTTKYFEWKKMNMITVDGIRFISASELFDYKSVVFLYQCLEDNFSIAAELLTDSDAFKDPKYRTFKENLCEFISIYLGLKYNLILNDIPGRNFESKLKNIIKKLNSLNYNI